MSGTDRGGFPLTPRAGEPIGRPMQTWRAPLLIDVVRKDLAENARSYVAAAWIAADAGCRGDDPRLWRALQAMAKQGEIAIVDGRVVCPPDLAPAWPDAKAAVMAAVGAGVSYGELQAAMSNLDETSLRCCLCVLVGDGALGATIPGGPGDWPAMSFRAKVPTSSG